MKKFLVSLMVFAVVCLVSFSSYAEVTAEIIATDTDNNGNIRVWTQYKVDGVEVESRYAKKNGKAVYTTRYNKQNFEGLSQVEITERINSDLEAHGKSLIQDAYNSKAPQTIQQIRVDYNRQANLDFMASMPVIVGVKVVVTEVKVEIDTNNDGIQDKEIILKSDGTHTEKTITP